jgi:hypothetical protein
MLNANKSYSNTLKRLRTTDNLSFPIPAIADTVRN